VRIEKLFGQASTLEIERLILRKMTLDDASDYYAFASDPLVTLHTIWSAHSSIEDSLQFLQGVIEKYERQESFHCY
jgi:ribosomal-protein-alanine N-acetyltransferase